MSQPDGPAGKTHNGRTSRMTLIPFVNGTAGWDSTAPSSIFTQPVTSQQVEYAIVNYVAASPSDVPWLD